MTNPRNRTTEDSPRAGMLLVDAWREEAELFDAAGKPVTAQRLRSMANRATAAMSAAAASRAQRA